MDFYGIPRELEISTVRGEYSRYRTNLEVAKERIHEEIKNNKRGENGIENTHKDKPPLQPRGGMNTT